MDYDEVKQAIGGRECRVCSSIPRIAWLKRPGLAWGEWTARCNCYPEAPMLRHRRMTGQDAVAERLAQMMKAKPTGIPGGVEDLYERQEEI